MSTFLTRRDAKQRLEEKKQEAAKEREEKRRLRLRHKDLMWCAKRRYLSDEEWYELHKLDNVYGKWGPEQAEYEFGKLAQLREYWHRHDRVKEGDPHLDALQKHLALHEERQHGEGRELSKKIVYAHPSEKLLNKQ